MRTYIRAPLVVLVVVFAQLTTLPIAQAAPPQPPAGPGEVSSGFVQADSSVVTQHAMPVSGGPATAPVGCGLAPPSLTSPVGGVELTTLAPTFQWTNMTAYSYYLELSTHSDFSAVDFAAGFSSITGASIRFAYNLTQNTTWYWRIATVCSDGSWGPYSSAASFKIGSVPGPFPDAPSMMAPADGAWLHSFDVDFSWGDVAGATDWQVRFYQSLAQAQSDTPSAGSSSAHLGTPWNDHYTRTFSFAGTYYWRVLAGNGAGWGVLSPVRSIKVGSLLYLPLISR
jgi:hypothetical protein